ncbi:hypothetical protein [Mycobacterium sp. URHB0044]|uniref:hypothetical protein n=1 Tax=Mycobacterium sp. URHB0044 TaxID=1380386 RepID=UPI0012DC3A41|nr:hypothetical protein [Mycobacterium sp. URHB0044]
MTLSKLEWLKRTNGHRFAGSELRVLLSIYNHSGADGKRSHPGIDVMIEETGYRKSGISEAVTALKERGWIHEVYRGNGRARQSSVFELVPDAPNPDHRCSSRSCSTCSNGSALAEPLSDANGSGTAELLSPNGSGFAPNGSAPAGPIVPLQRSPSDPVSDPKGSDPVDELARPSDPREVRYSPNHQVDSVETASRSLPSREEEMNRTDSTDRRVATAHPDDPFADSSESALDLPFIKTEPATLADEGWSDDLFVNADYVSVTRWPSGKPLPDLRDPFTTYVDETTGEPITT